MRALVIPVVLALTSLGAAVTLAAREPPASTLPRMPDGRPDLQGVWLNNDATPLERPKALAGRVSLTDAEVTELRKRASRLLADPANDFAAGDNLFIAALNNVDQYKNPHQTTGGTTEMIEREFDNRTSLIVDPPDGRIPWTPEGQRRSDAALTTWLTIAPPSGPEDLANDTRCLTYGVPRIGAQNSNSAGPLGYYQIVQSPGYVVLFYEAIHEARIVPLDNRPRLPQHIWQWAGDSRGWWEGNTLVIESENFSPHANVLGSGAHLHLVERLTRVTGDRLDYQMTLSDPITWAKPWTVEIHLKQSADQIYEYACHEGSFTIIQDLLAGARAAEKADEVHKQPQ